MQRFLVRLWKTFVITTCTKMLCWRSSLSLVEKPRFRVKFLTPSTANVWWFFSGFSSTGSKFFWIWLGLSHEAETGLATRWSGNMGLSFYSMNQLNFYGLRTNNVNQVGVINVDNDNDSDKSRYTQTKPKGCKIIVERFTVPKWTNYQNTQFSFFLAGFLVNYC